MNHQFLTADEVEVKLMDSDNCESWEVEELMSMVNAVQTMVETFNIPFNGFSVNKFDDVEVHFKDKDGQIFINCYDRPELSI